MNNNIIGNVKQKALPYKESYNTKINIREELLKGLIDLSLLEDVKEINNKEGENGIIYKYGKI